MTKHHELPAGFRGGALPPSRPARSSLRDHGSRIRNRLGLHPRPRRLVTLWLVVFPRDCPLCQQDRREQGPGGPRQGWLCESPGGIFLRRGVPATKLPELPSCPRSRRPFPTYAPLCTLHETLLPQLSLLALQPQVTDLSTLGSHHFLHKASASMLGSHTPAARRAGA